MLKVPAGQYFNPIYRSCRNMTTIYGAGRLNEIERDSYSLMKPRFKEEISKLKNKLTDLESKETNYKRYLNSGITLLQNLRFYYEAASVPNKQKLIGSIFPENLIIENGKCRTARENEVICVS